MASVRLIDARQFMSQVPYIRPGAEPYGERPLDGIRGVTVHYTASHPNTSVWAVALYQVSDAVLAVGQPLFPSIAYHWYVTGDGVVYRCHDLATRVWHSAAVVDGIKRNRSHVAVCYAGDRRPTEVQIQGIRQAIALTQEELGRELEVEGHKDFYATACPGPFWVNWRTQVVVPYHAQEDDVTREQWEAIVRAAAAYGVVANGVRAMADVDRYGLLRKLSEALLAVDKVRAMEIIREVEAEALVAEKRRLGVG